MIKTIEKTIDATAVSKQISTLSMKRGEKWVENTKRKWTETSNSRRCTVGSAFTLHFTVVFAGSNETHDAENSIE